MVLPIISSFLGHSFVVHQYIYVYAYVYVYVYIFSSLSLNFKYLANIAELGVGKERKDTFQTVTDDNGSLIKMSLCSLPPLRLQGHLVLSDRKKQNWGHEVGREGIVELSLHGKLSLL